MGTSLRYIVVVLLIIFFGVLGTIFIIGRFNNRSRTITNQPSTVHVADYVNKDASSVRWTQEGRLVGTDKRRAIQITVSPTERRVDILEGYDQKVLKTAVFKNDKTAYTNFLLALENIRYGLERKVKQPDERGVCPLGSRFIYELRDANEQKFRLWSDSCAAADGTFAGNTSVARQLFKAQITDYEKFIIGTQL